TRRGRRRNRGSRRGRTIARRRLHQAVELGRGSDMRMLALLRKELADERQNLGLFVPSLIVAVVAILLPVFVAIVVPYATGERFLGSGDSESAVDLNARHPAPG